MRIGGLASGMDIDSLVSDLMKAESIPLDKLEQKKKYMEWQRDDYREINKMMLDLDTTIFEDLILSDTYSQKTVSVSDSSAVSIENLTSTTDFSGTIQVERLASSATMVSAETVIDPTKKLSEYVTGTQTIKIKAIKEDGTLQADDTVTDETLQPSDKETVITFNPAEETIESLISKINEQSNVNMFFDSVTGKVSVTAKNTGNVPADPTNGETAQTAEIIFEDSTGGFIQNVLKLNLNNNTTNGTNVNSVTAGVDAKFTYNGLETTRPSNTFAINGFEITLKNPTGNDKVTFNSKADVDAITEKIVKFVDEYNKLIEKVNGELNEKRYRDYQPLTEEQKKEMDEKTIEMWEEKARSGTLRSDSVLSSSINKLRSNFYSPVSGLTGINQLAEIGITTTRNYLDGGKLTIDEDKLKEAISKDPNAIYQLFTKDGETTAEKGIARRLRDTLDATMNSIEEKAGKTSSTNNTFSLGKMLNNIDNQIDRFQDRLIQVEDRYWRQFTAMEKAIQQANQQSTYLMQQFGGM
jgi:flagellar hook-associated protein 2